MTRNIKQIIVIIVIIVIAFIGFKMFFSSDVPTDSALTADQARNEDFVDGQTILVTLDKLKNLDLDTSIFKDKTFVSLESFERTLDSQVLERKNPFLPIGVENRGASIQRTASTTSTTKPR
jgi:hypothetical protein